MKFIIPEKPRPQQRPMFHHGYIAMERPESRKAKKLIAQYAVLSLQANGNRVFSGDFKGRIEVRLSFFGANPAADLDNLYKLVTDACQGVLYKNDSQIDRAQIYRFKGKKGEERTEVEVIDLYESL